MIDQFILRNAEIVMIVWAAATFAGHYIRRLVAESYSAGAGSHFGFEGGVNPYKGSEGMLRSGWILRSSLRSDLISVPATVVIYLLGRYWVPMEFFAGATGVLLLGLVPVWWRALRNAMTFRLVRIPGAVSGRIDYSNWFSTSLSAWENLSFAALFLLVSVPSDSWFFVGGTVFCFGVGSWHWIWARKIRPVAKSV